MQTNRKTANEQKKEYNSSRHSGLPSFPRSLSTLSVRPPPPRPHSSHLLFHGPVPAAPPSQSLGCWSHCVHTVQRTASIQGFTFQLDFVQRQMGEEVPSSSSYQIGIVVSCLSESRVPLKDLPSESLLPETTPVLGFFPFPNLFPTLLLVFLGSFFWKLFANTLSSQELIF